MPACELSLISQEESKLGTTLSRSVPVSDDVALTLQNGFSMTRSLPRQG